MADPTPQEPTTAQLQRQIRVLGKQNEYLQTVLQAQGEELQEAQQELALLKAPPKAKQAAKPKPKAQRKSGNGKEAQS